MNLPTHLSTYPLKAPQSPSTHPLSLSRHTYQPIHSTLPPQPTHSPHTFNPPPQSTLSPPPHPILSTHPLSLHRHTYQLHAPGPVIHVGVGLDAVLLRGGRLYPHLTYLPPPHSPTLTSLAYPHLTYLPPPHLSTPTSLIYPHLTCLPPSHLSTPTSSLSYPHHL